MKGKRPLDLIIDLGSRFYDVPRSELVSECREERLAKIRFSIWTVCRADGYSLNAIGNAFNRDHGSVLYGLRRVSPECFGTLWDAHSQFIAFAAIDRKESNPIKGIRSEIDRRLEAIDREINFLREARGRLTSAKEALC